MPDLSVVVVAVAIVVVAVVIIDAFSREIGRSKK